MSGVGGRRWCKLADGLVNLGCEVHVFSGTPRKFEVSPWNVNEKVKTMRLPNLFPSKLTQVPVNIFDKILYRLSLIFMKTVTKSNYYDRAVLWKRKYHEIIYPFIIENEITNVIATGGPFSIPYYATFLKKKIANLNLIVDLRDEWGAAEFYGFGIISTKRQQAELKRLGATLNVADIVTVPYEYMATKYKNYININKEKVKLLPHGFDGIFNSEQINKNQGHHLKMVNFGSLHSGLESIMKDLTFAVRNLDIQIAFFTNEFKYKDIFKNYNVNNKVNFNQTVSENEVSEIYRKSDAALLFIPKHFKDSITTKYMEIIACRLPIVAVGEYGEVARFIENNNLGVFIEKDEIKSKFINIQEILNNLQYNNKFDLTRYQLNHLSQQVYNLLK